MSYLLIAELASGIVALILTAVAFIEMAWSEGGSQDNMKRTSRARSGKLFMAAGFFWFLTVCFFLAMR